MDLSREVDRARAKITGLFLDTEHEQGRDLRKLTASESEALRIVLDELHRLNVAVSTQRKELENRHPHENRAHRKPQDARSQTTTTRDTTGKSSRNK